MSASATFRYVKLHVPLHYQQTSQELNEPSFDKIDAPLVIEKQKSVWRLRIQGWVWCGLSGEMIRAGGKPVDNVNST